MMVVAFTLLTLTGYLMIQPLNTVAEGNKVSGKPMVRSFEPRTSHQDLWILGYIRRLLNDLARRWSGVR